MVWEIVNRTAVEHSVTLELMPSRSWALARTLRGIVVPPDEKVRFLVPSAVPDTAAAGVVSILARAHADDDTTTFDSCTGVLFVQSAPPAAVPAVVVADLVRLEWHTGMLRQSLGIVELSRDDQGWHPEGGVTADDGGGCTFEDRRVTPGSTIQYRLRSTVLGVSMVSAVTTVHVPELTPLACAGLRPNPSQAIPVVAFTLPDRASTRLDVYDMAGRRVYASELGVLAPGAHVQTLAPNAALRSGVYVFRLTQGARSVSVRGVIAR